MTELPDFGPSAEPNADLYFLRDEGLEVLALYKAIRSDPTRRMLRELIRTIVAGQRDQSRDGDGQE